jgi:hypothetical protein
MYRLIELAVIAIPIVLFLKALFPGQSKRLSQAFSELKKQLDYLVWVMLFLIGCGIVYSIAMLVFG